VDLILIVKIGSLIGILIWYKNQYETYVHLRYNGKDNRKAMKRNDRNMWISFIVGMIIAYSVTPWAIILWWNILDGLTNSVEIEELRNKLHIN